MLEWQGPFIEASPSLVVMQNFSKLLIFVHVWRCLYKLVRILTILNHSRLSHLSDRMRMNGTVIYHVCDNKHQAISQY